MRFKRDTDDYEAHAVLISLQPGPALVALIGCMCIFAFGSATWWYSDITAGKFFIAYSAQTIVLSIFVALKTIRFYRTGSIWTPHLTAFAGFTENLDNLLRLIKKSPVRSISLANLERSNLRVTNDAAQSSSGMSTADSQPARNRVVDN